MDATDNVMLAPMYMVENPGFGERGVIPMQPQMAIHVPSNDAERTVQMRALALARAEALVLVLTQAEKLASARPAARARTRALALAQALAQAREIEEARDWEWTQAGGEPGLAQEHMVTYEEMLADSKLKKVIYSIEPHHRHRLAHDLSSHYEYWWLIQILVPITRLPQELLRVILLIIIDEASDPPLALMQVSKHWYQIVVGIWASLTLGTSTPKDTVTSTLKSNPWFLDVSVDTEIDRGDFTPEGAYQAIFAAMQAASRWRSLVIETFPAGDDLPEHLVNSGLQQFSDAVMSRLRTIKIKCRCEMSPLLERLLRILGTAASGELTVVEINSPVVISFLAPTYSSIFHSIKVLRLDTPGLPDTVDILPHLHQLESLTASHLSLPIYHNDITIPCVRTLRHLELKATSIQWMSGRTLQALESCILLFPLHRHVLHTFSTTLPKCNALKFQGYPLDILHGVTAPKVARLSVVSSCSDKRRGNQQLDWFSNQVLQESRLAPRRLHISIEAMSQSWTKALAFMSNLEELVINNAQPYSLGVKVLQSLVVRPTYASNLGTTSTPMGEHAPVCPSLKRLALGYRRWLRPTEHFDLIPEFLSIIWSRQQSNISLQSFQIWTGGDREDPLELIEGSWISLEGFGHLARDCAIEDGNWLRLVASRLVENMFKPCPLPHALKCK